MNSGRHRLLRPSWIISHILVCALVVSTFTLGMWQLSRLDERQSYNSIVASRFEQPVEQLSDLLQSFEEESDILYRVAEVSGEFDPSKQIYVVNRSQNGVAGVHVVTALEILESSLFVAINRGFIPRSVYLETNPEDLSPPTGKVDVIGLVIAGKKDDRGYGDEMAEIDLEALSDYWQIDLTSVVLQRKDLDAVTGIPIPLLPPDLTEGPHLSYAVQWFIFMSIALIGYPLVLRKVSKETVQIT